MNETTPPKRRGTESELPAPDPTRTLNTVIGLLAGLSDRDRVRILKAAMVFYSCSDSEER